MSSSNGNLGSIQMNSSNIQSASSQPPQLNLPCPDLLDEGRKQEYLEICFPLYEASMRGDWKAAKDILNNRDELIRFSINGHNETSLHVAAYRGHTSFVENLVVIMDNMDLELQNSSSNTALCLAAVAGHVDVAKVMVTKHNALLDIAGSQGRMPLHMAALSGKHDMMKYLYEKSERMSRGIWTDERLRDSVLLACVEAELYDVAIQIVNDCPGLAKSGGGTLLRVLARKPHAFMTKLSISRIQFWFWLLIKVKALIGGEKHQTLQLFRIIWEIIEKLPKDEIDEILRGPADKDDNLTSSSLPRITKYSSRLLFLAAETGNAEFIVEIVRKYPERVLELNDNKQSIFHVAVLYRHANIYPLLYEMGSIKESIVNLEDINGNNMLHIVGILEETSMRKKFEDMSQIYVQMEEELRWFKKVNATIPPSLRVKKNKAGLSPLELFIENHKDVVSKSQEWMKKTFSELLLLAALIITISFAAAISFASGSNPDSTRHDARMIYNVFMLFNGFSFLSASASIISMLSIIGSRYAEHDFMESLPTNLDSVITALKISMAFMLSAFIMTIALLYNDHNSWVTLVMVALSIMVVLFFEYRAYIHRSSFLASRYKMILLRKNGIMY